MQTQRGRSQLVDLAGLDELRPQLDLEGPSLVVVGDLIQALEVYGRVSYGEEALGLFLNTLKEITGRNELTDLIDELLIGYELTTPVPSAPPMAPQIAVLTPDAQEKIIGENTLRHISFLVQGVEASRAVALIRTREWVGTGFLASEDLIVTNHHVIPNIRVAADSVFCFNYVLGRDGRLDEVHQTTVKPSGLFWTSEDLDATIVQVEGRPGDEWGMLQIADGDVQAGQRVNIIQHPAGMPKQVSLNNNFVEYVNAKVMQYVTSTLGGSSGAPVMNEEWKVVGVHHAGGLLLEPATGRHVFRNEGVLAKTIWERLPEVVQEQLARNRSSHD